jgi:hypothetical protein
MTDVKLALGWEAFLAQNSEQPGGLFGIGDNLFWTHWPPGSESYEAQAASIQALTTNVITAMAGAGAKRILFDVSIDPTFKAWLASQGHTITDRNASNKTTPLSVSTHDVFIYNGLNYLEIAPGPDYITTGNNSVRDFILAGGTVIHGVDANSFPSYSIPLYTAFGITQSNWPDHVFSNQTVNPYDVSGVPYFSGVTALNIGTSARYTALGTSPNGGTNYRWQGRVGAGTPEYIFAGWRP